MTTVPSGLLMLAPDDLPILRPLRYDGAGQEVALSRFAPEDRVLLATLYDGVQGLGCALQTMRETPDWIALTRSVLALGDGRLLETARLLGSAEDEARRRGCGHSHLYSYSFQAPGFYVKHGYAIYGALEGYPPGEKRVLLRKKL